MAFAVLKNGIQFWRPANASALRMQDDVPLVVPEINPDHLGLVQKNVPIVTNPNCATVGLALTLKPLVDAFGVDRVQVTTMQAVSGAGYPGVSALDILGNVVPFINGEEEKLEEEPGKILGRYIKNRIDPLPLTISVQTNRVPVMDGHLLCVSARLGKSASPPAVAEPMAGFVSRCKEFDLPSAPTKPLVVVPSEQGPQARLHLGLNSGMTVSVGRIRRCPVEDIRYVALVHNRVRGAAGAAILNAESMVKKGLIQRRS